MGMCRIVSFVHICLGLVLSTQRWVYMEVFIWGLRSTSNPRRQIPYESFHNWSLVVVNSRSLKSFVVGWVTSLVPESTVTSALCAFFAHPHQQCNALPPPPLHRLMPITKISILYFINVYRSYILLGHLNPNVATFKKSSNLMARVGGLSATWCKYENTLQPHTLQNDKIFNFKTTFLSLIDKWMISIVAMYIFMHLASTLLLPFDFIS